MRGFAPSPTVEFKTPFSTLQYFLRVFVHTSSGRKDRLSHAMIRLVTRFQFNSCDSERNFEAHVNIERSWQSPDYVVGLPASDSLHLSLSGLFCLTNHEAHAAMQSRVPPGRRVVELHACCKRKYERPMLRLHGKRMLVQWLAFSNPYLWTDQDNNS